MQTQHYESKKYELSMPAKMAFSSSIRRTSSEVFKYLGFKDPELFRLVLVIDELYMNAVQHGSNNDSYIHIIFQYTLGEKIQVIIDDEGKGENCSPESLQEKMAQEFQRHDDKKISGRGLAQITLNLADDLAFQRNCYGGIRVIFEKSLPKK